jgi:FkbM family methyltransferase
MLSTSRKIQLARLASRTVRLARRALGRAAQGEFVRSGIRWRLDLAEGIDFSIYLLGAFEPATVRAYGRLVRSGDCVLDIGANVGAHTLPLARLVGPRGRVAAFEPTLYAVRKCAANLALNPELAARVSLHQVMLAADPSEALPPAVFSSWPLAEQEGLHQTHRGRLMDTSGARVATLDRMCSELGLGALDFIKLDVDGYEYPVLAGGRGTLERFRPVIALELAPYVHAEHGHTFEELLALLGAAGYGSLDIPALRQLPAGAAALRARIPEGGSINVIAAAGDRLAALTAR